MNISGFIGYLYKDSNSVGYLVYTVGNFKSPYFDDN